MYKVIWGSILGLLALCAAVCAYSYIVEQARQKLRKRLLARIGNAESLLQSGMHDDALNIYEDILSSLKSGAGRPFFQDVYALCKYGLGKYFRKKAADDFSACRAAIENYEEFLHCLASPGIDLEEAVKKIEAQCDLGLLYVILVKQVKIKNWVSYLRRAETLLETSLAYIDDIARQAADSGDPAKQELTSTKVYASIHQALGIIALEISATQLHKEAERYLMEAVSSFDRALQSYSAREYPSEYADVLGNKASAYKKLFELTANVNYMSVAVDVLKTLVDHLEKNGKTGETPEVIQNLAAIHSAIAQRLMESADNEQFKETIRTSLLAASECYEKIIGLQDRATVPATRGELAHAYKKFADIKVKLHSLDQQTSFLDEAMALYLKSLEYVAEGSLDFANTQCVIGDLYAALSRTRARKDNIAKARAAYNAALKIYEEIGLVPQKRNVELSLKGIETW
ncbi:MAG TPA: hypothetical protein VF790_12515 [Dissulfurispiraceae bacterium]